jgi:hypothetical protein
MPELEEGEEVAAEHAYYTHKKATIEKFASRNKRPVVLLCLEL